MAPLAMASSVVEFAAMGSTCRVSTWAASPAVASSLARRARQRVAHMETLWSRFLPGSELSMLNARSGSADPLAVSAETAMLLHVMVDAWRLTSGLCTAAVLDALVTLGYDRDFASLTGSSWAGSPLPVPSLDGVHPGLLVALPAGVRLDPGGIGKGLAGDIVVEELLRGGATGVLVDVGGDLSLGGAPGLASWWEVDVATSSQAGTAAALRLRLPAGQRWGVATSGVRRRAWSGVHHLLDPRTGLPAVPAWPEASVVHRHAWQAEAWVKALLLDGSLPPHSGALAWAGLDVRGKVAACWVRA